MYLMTYLYRVLDLFELITHCIRLVHDLKDRIAHRGLVQQVIYRHSGQALLNEGLESVLQLWPSPLHR